MHEFDRLLEHLNEAVYTALTETVPQVEVDRSLYDGDQGWVTVPFGTNPTEALDEQFGELRDQIVSDIQAVYDNLTEVGGGTQLVISDLRLNWEDGSFDIEWWATTQPL